MTTQDVFDETLILLEHMQKDLLLEIGDIERPFVATLTTEIIDDFVDAQEYIVGWHLEKTTEIEITQPIIDPDSCEKLNHYIFKLLNDKAMDIMEHLNEYEYPLESLKEKADVAKDTLESMVNIIDREEAKIIRSCLLA